jgi:hypothetical protein
MLVYRRVGDVPDVSHIYPMRFTDLQGIFQPPWSWRCPDLYEDVEGWGGLSTRSMAVIPNISLVHLDSSIGSKKLWSLINF